MPTHTDFGWLTFLLQSKTKKPSLEICDKSGHWRGVHPQPDSMIVNFGDMMSAWSEGKVWAREHRVIAGDPDEARMSIPFFYEPCLDAHVGDQIFGLHLAQKLGYFPKESKL